MATVTFIKYQKQSASALRGVAQYVSQDEKTLDEKRQPVDQRAELHAPTGQPGVPGHAGYVPQGESRVVLHTTSSPFLRMR